MHITGMRSNHRIDAYGAPLVIIREQRSADPPRSDPFIPPEGAIYPATATLRFDAHNVELTLWNPDHAITMQQLGQTLRLSTNTTAPIATLFARTQLGSEGRAAMFNVSRYVPRIGIYMHEPYDPEEDPRAHGARTPLKPDHLARHAERTAR